MSGMGPLKPKQSAAGRQPVQDLPPPDDVAAAYAVQEINTDPAFRTPPGRSQDWADLKGRPGPVRRRPSGLRHAVR